MSLDTSTRSTQGKGVCLLLLAAMIWGGALIAMKAGTASLGPLSFTGVRCLLGGCAMLPVIAVLDRRKTPEQRRAESDPKVLWAGSLLCGIINISYLVLQQIGIEYTSVGKGAFITALYVVLTPFLGVFLRRKIPARIWFCALLALVGFYCMSMLGQDWSSLNRGDLMMLCASVGCALHLYAVDYYVARVNAVKLSSYQFITAGLLCTLAALVTEDLTLAGIREAAIPILYAGVASCGLGYTCQMIGQKYVEPAMASLLASSETLFAMAAGFLFFHEILTPQEYLGAALIAVAIVLAQVQRKKRDPLPALTPHAETEASPERRDDHA